MAEWADILYLPNTTDSPEHNTSVGPLAVVSKSKLSLNTFNEFSSAVKLSVMAIRNPEHKRLYDRMGVIGPGSGGLMRHRPDNVNDLSSAMRLSVIAIRSPPRKRIHGRLGILNLGSGGLG